MLNKKPEDFSFTTMWQMFLKKGFIDKNSDIKFTKDIVMGPDAVFTHKILCQTDNIEVNKHSTHFYRRYPEQISSSIESQPEKLLYYIKMMLEDIEQFYNDRNLWEVKNNHFMNFLLEHPFYHYLHADFNIEQKTEIFDLVHSLIQAHNLKENFSKKDIRIFLFKKFLICNKSRDFELYLIFIKCTICLKTFIKNIIKGKIS